MDLFNRKKIKELVAENKRISEELKEIKSPYYCPRNQSFQDLWKKLNVLAEYFGVTFKEEWVDDEPVYSQSSGEQQIKIWRVRKSKKKLKKN